MAAPIYFDDATAAEDEISVTDVDNELLTTLVKFARAIRDHRRDAAAIREKLLSFIFTITAAEHAAIVPVAGSELQVENASGKNRRSSSEPIRLKRTVVEQVHKYGIPVMSRSMICVAMQAFHGRLGVLYIQTADRRRRLDRRQLELLLGVAAVAAITIEHAASVEVLETRNSLLQQDLDIRNDLLGGSRKMSELNRLIGKTAASDSTVLIQGESGTGKELVARAIHHNSKRSAGPFVAINCGAITETLFESELFGHEKGSFTGAMVQKKGKFEIAGGGTLFLDEVGELPAALQAKLLRVLQEREIERVGGTKPIKVDIRLIAATNRDLDQAVDRYQFREDLYYRLKVVTILTPPLRERRDDILVLARHFVSKYAAEACRNMRGIAASAERILENYDWPGNVRELQNVIERAITLGSADVVLPEDLPADLITGRTRQRDIPAFDYKEMRRARDREALELALSQAGGNCAQAAGVLDVNLSTIYRRIKILKSTHLLKRPRD